MSKRMGIDYTRWNGMESQLDLNCEGFLDG